MEQTGLVHVEVPTEPVRVVKCRGCHRRLRDAASRALEHGPECLAKRFAARRGKIEQDALPGV